MLQLSHKQHLLVKRVDTKCRVKFTMRKSLTLTCINYLSQNLFSLFLTSLKVGRPYLVNLSLCMFVPLSCFLCQKI